MLTPIVTVALLALAVSSVSVTMTKSSIFKSTREWIDEKSSFFGDLVHCPYCTSHWLSFAAVAVYQPRLLDSPYWVFDYAVSAFVIVTLASMSSGLVIRAFK